MNYLQKFLRQINFRNTEAGKRKGFIAYDLASQYYKLTNLKDMIIHFSAFFLLQVQFLKYFNKIFLAYPKSLSKICFDFPIIEKYRNKNIIPSHHYWSY